MTSQLKTQECPSSFFWSLWAFSVPADGAKVCVGAELQHWCKAALQRPAYSTAHPQPVICLLRDKNNCGITTLISPHKIAHSEATRLRHTCRRCEPLPSSEPDNSMRRNSVIRSGFLPCGAWGEAQDSHTVGWLISFPLQAHGSSSQQRGAVGQGRRHGKKRSAAVQRPADTQPCVAAQERQGGEVGQNLP